VHLLAAVGGSLHRPLRITQFVPSAAALTIHRRPPQYMVLNFNRFVPGKELQPGLLWVVEQLPDVFLVRQWQPRPPQHPCTSPSLPLCAGPTCATAPSHCRHLSLSRAASAPVCCLHRMARIASYRSLAQLLLGLVFTPSPSPPVHRAAPNLSAIIRCSSQNADMTQELARGYWCVCWETRERARCT
jgi:hypothetical protein